MSRILISMLRVVGLLGALILIGNPAFSQTAQDDLSTQKVKLHLNQGTLLQALSILSVEQRIPIGFEPALDHKAAYRLNLDAENVTLEEVLDRIVQQEPNYRWEVKDGVINLIPRKSRDDFVERLLGTRIQQFEPPKVLAIAD